MKRSLIVKTLCLPFLVTSTGAGPQDVANRPIHDLIPADPLVVYVAKPYGRQATPHAGDQSPSAASSIATILAFLSAAGLVPDEGQVYVDIAAALPLLGRFEHALVLLDISSRLVETPAGAAEPGPQLSLRLQNLQTAVIFRTDGQHRVVLEQLNRIIGRYTNQDVAELTTSKLDGIEYQRLADTRLPGWAVWEWGRLDDFIVLSFGEGAFARIVDCYQRKAPALSSDVWLRAARKDAKSDNAIAQWFIALERIEKRIGEVAHGRYQRVVEALGADGMDADLWTVGLDGEALSWSRRYRRNGQDVDRHYSDPANYSPAHRRVIPDEAHHYAVITVPTRWLVDNLPRAWLAGQSDRNIEKWRRVWRGLERETGIDLSDNLLINLGDHVVIFDYPAHPLGIPVALTVAIEIRDHRAVKVAVESLLSAWGQYLDDRAERKGTTLVRVKVQKTSDEIWFLQAGIMGPALKVTDRYVVLSWSPQALRDALRHIEAPAAGPEIAATPLPR